ncbi:MAG TPA: hypothetical protein VEM15_14050, partial [Thermodesulfobacteriota bacterium]|nr:hypothetical protein [Thermodesulfobacteriota bacterium]
RRRQLNESGAHCLMLRWISPPVDNPPKPWRRRVFQWRYHGLCPWGSIYTKLDNGDRSDECVMAVESKQCSA